MSLATDPPITSFFGEYRFLSNFWLCDVEWNAIIHPSAENAYVAAKISPYDIVTQRKISTMSPGEAKRFSRTVELDRDWDRFKGYFMAGIVRDKFNRNPDLAEKLKATGNALLVEGNTWNDRYWGQCPVGNGENHLGKILMNVRERL